MRTKEAPRPRWRQIADTLSAELEAGTWKAGDRLPGEYALADRFEVNRHTLRQAVSYLENEGLLRAEQGRGIFVPDPPIHYAVTPHTRFSDNIGQAQRRPSRRLLRASEIAADPALAAAMQIPVDTRLICLETLSMADDRPVGIGSHYYPQARVPDIATAFTAERSITAALRRCGVPDYKRRTTRISAQLISNADARVLGVRRGRAVLVTDSVNVEPDGSIIEFGHGRMLGDLMTFVVEF
ncbi:phosphonate metabolism transcriptional regulator PhnF [Reyranella sp. CPCC 100927]|uniref:phosphonate metabolism transcriptional regulator PhnF n=1 Tax=Reyranella sp. CPCC 100927 TaxID=2599616 RepID=UPI0011B44A01|nr:phosphonate metabolism transcriptional regulator PhnF [Reyranella sp. CPCC 100927]TWS95151.1 phosphonate metabolism transcriptional regulator PhnF [Reyranella sp. CPCC 100927]